MTLQKRMPARRGRQLHIPPTVRQHIMKALITSLILLIPLISYGQKNNYSDWFDFNLKAKPKSTKEITLLALPTYFKPDFLEYLNNSLKLNAFVDEYYFDTLGLISKEFHKAPVDTMGQWTDYSKMKVIQYKDSIILINYYSDNSEAWREKRFLDKDGYMRCKIVDSACPDTVMFKRDSNNRIIKKFRSWYCIDYGQKVNTEYALNENGDISLERQINDSISSDNYGPLNNKDLLRYEYIYDTNFNWVIKVTYQDNEIILITQREIKY
jgi:hypothetical protein